MIGILILLAVLFVAAAALDFLLGHHPSRRLRRWDKKTERFRWRGF